jgi:hypothetical protein
VGLANVDNTSDANKPVSTAVTAALALKANSASPQFTGVVTMPGATVSAPVNTAGNVIQVAVGENQTLDVAADTEFTFGGTPSPGQQFNWTITNGGATIRTITIPPCISLAQNASITSFKLLPNARLKISFIFDGTDYWVVGETQALNNFSATTDPTVTDDETKGYALGSIWLNTANSKLFVLSNPVGGAAVWLQPNVEAGGGGAGVTDGDKGDVIVSASGATWTVKSETIDDRIAALLQAGANITLTYNDAGNTLTIAATPFATAAAGTSLSLAQSTVYAPFTVTGPTTLTISGGALGAKSEMLVIADGVNIPTIVGATAWDSNAGYLNTAGVRNQLDFWHNGDANHFAWSQAQDAVAPTPAPPAPAPTPPAPAPATAPDAVTNLASTGTTANTISLSWTAPAGTMTDYVIQYATAGTSFASPTTFADGTSTATTATITGLTASTAYDVRVAAVNSAGTGPYADLLNVSTAAAAGGSTTGTPVVFSSMVNMTSLGDEIYAATSAGTSNTALGVVTGTAAGDFFAEMQFPEATSTSSMLALDATAPASRPYGQADFLVQLGSTGTVTWAQNSITMSAALTTLTASPTTRVGVRRVGSTLTIETTTDDWATSTVRHTFGTTTAATLSLNFHTTYSTTARRVCQPRVTGFA